MPLSSQPDLRPRASLALLFALFFAFGFLAALNDVLVADLRAVFHLTYRSATLVQFSYFSTCFLFSLPASLLLTRLGYRVTMTLALAIMAFGALCFIHAATATFPFFLCALAIMACGSTALQTSASPYVSLLGSEKTAPGRFSLALAVNSFGAMLAPLFGAAFLMPGATVMTSRSASLRLPYLGIAVGLFGLALVVRSARLPSLPQREAIHQPPPTYYRLLHHPRLIFGVIAMLLYVGAEVAIGSLLINFLGQPDTSALPPQRAALLASLYGAGAMIGRFFAPSILNRFRPPQVLTVAAVLAILFVLMAIVITGPLASYSLLAVGLCNSVMVPILFTTAISGLGPLTGRGSGLLVAALIGGAIIPLAQGSLADRIGLHGSFLLPSLCYLAVFAYARYSLRPPRPSFTTWP